jgi:hypothetical protein
MITQRALMILLMVCSIILFISNYYVNMDQCLCGGNDCNAVAPKLNASRGSLVVATMLFTLSLSFFLMVAPGVQKSLINTNLVAVAAMLLGIVLITLNSIVINVSNRNKNCSRARIGGVIGLVTGIVVTLVSGVTLGANNMKMILRR